jgi:hypothetical protein
MIGDGVDVCTSRFRYLEASTGLVKAFGVGVWSLVQEFILR